MDSVPDFYKTWNSLAGRYFGWQAEQFSPYLGRRIADIGCGPGNLAPALLGRELYLAVDANAAMLELVNEAHGHHSELATAQLDVTSPELSERLRSFCVDTIVCANLLEHIEHDGRCVSSMLDALPPGGHLCILVPAMPWAFGTLDELDGHFRRYTKASLLRRLVDGQACNVEMLRYFNSVGCLGWWWKGRVLRRQGHDENSYRAMNALVPVLSRAERLIPPPFGLSVTAVLRKHR